MSLHIITDSASDITPDEAKELGITVVPLKTVFGTTEYLDGIDLTANDFYEKLVETDELPSTSQISPYQYEIEYRAALATNDEVLVITLSQKLSGCYQSALIARDALDPEQAEHVTVVDTLSVTIGEQLLIELALRMRDEGKSAAEIGKMIENRRNDVKVIALLDTLEFLKRGGRISPTVAMAGNLLNIKPVLTVKDGLVELLGKARGSKNGNNYLNKFVAENGGIDYDAPYRLAYSGMSDALLQKYIRDSKALYADKVDFLPITQVGSVIGTHAGPGAVALAFFAANDK
ncbi:MAG: DegV family protein [Eggerthellales bacterium]|nr:DegV family protein [Eggerthellales bacterium]